MAFNSNSDKCNFGFAHNDPRFSDRVLLIEVMANSGYGNAERGTQISKRMIENGEGSSGNPRDENNVITDIPDEKNDKDGDTMINEASSGEGATKSCDTIRSINCLTAPRVNAIHVNSAILAAKSPFFYRLFSNGVKELKERTATLQIDAKGATGCKCVCYHIAQLPAMHEDALMDLLNFIYHDTLSTTASSSLEDVMLVAHRFEVASCVRYCSEQISKLPMTCESAVRYLNLTSRFSRAEAIQPLTDAAKQFLANQFNDLDIFRDQVLELPLSSFEAVLSSDELRACSEDVVYDIVLKYAARHYQRLDDRKEILDRRLRHLIRFPHMSTQKLKKVLTSRNFSSQVISKVVLEALLFKTDADYRKHVLDSTRPRDAGQTRDNIAQFVERAYKHRPVKVIEIERPYHHSVAYLDLKREECLNLFPDGKVFSQIFHLGSHRFFLSAHCNMDRDNTMQCFGLFISMQEREPTAVEAKYEFAVRTKPEENFEMKYTGNYVFTGRKAVGVRNLFLVPWSEFIGEDSVCFINGILHLRVLVAIK